MKYLLVYHYHEAHLGPAQHIERERERERETVTTQQQQQRLDANALAGLQLSSQVGDNLHHYIR